MIDESQVETEQASPEEQAQYEQAMDIALKVLHGEKTGETIFQTVVNAQTPVDGIARATFILIKRVQNEIKGLQESVLLQVGQEIVAEIVELMVASERMSEGEVNDEFLEQVISKIYMHYQDDAEANGTLNKQGIEQDLMDAGVKGSLPVNAMSNEEVQARGLMNV